MRENKQQPFNSASSHQKHDLSSSHAQGSVIVLRSICGKRTRRNGQRVEVSSHLRRDISYKRLVLKQTTRETARYFAIAEAVVDAVVEGAYWDAATGKPPIAAGGGLRSSRGGGR